MIRCTVVPTLGLCLILASSPPIRAQSEKPAAAAANPEEKSVRDTVAAYVGAFNGRDAAKLAEFFAADATLADAEGVTARGKEAIAQQYAGAFALPSTYSLETTVESLRFVTPDVAQIEGVSRQVSPKEATVASKYVALLKKESGGWKIVEIRDYPAATENVKPHERLKELEWMVGDWVDQGEDSHVKSSVRWGEGKGYLVREYAVHHKNEAPRSGLMIIAWDPLTEKIKSWTFNSEGSHGEGLWTRAAENEWLVKVSGTTNDGRHNSVTQVITQVSKDAVKTKSVDRVIGGEVADDLEEMIMVRKPPSPAGSSIPVPTK